MCEATKNDRKTLGGVVRLIHMWPYARIPAFTSSVRRRFHGDEYDPRFHACFGFKWVANLSKVKVMAHKLLGFRDQLDQLATHPSSFLWTSYGEADIATAKAEC